MLLDAVGHPHYLAVLRISATLTSSPGGQGKLTKYGILFAKDYFGQDTLRPLECAIPTEYESQLKATAKQEQRHALNFAHIYKIGIREQAREAGQDQDCPDDEMRGSKRKRSDDQDTWQLFESSIFSDKVKTASKSGWWLYTKAAIYTYDGSSETATQGQATELEPTLLCENPVEGKAGEGGLLSSLTVPGSIYRPSF